MSQLISDDEVDSLYPASPVKWSVADKIELSDVRELKAFEDTMTQYVDQEAFYKWTSLRPELGEVVRPRKPKRFNGALVDIILVPIENPVEQILNMSEGVALINTSGKPTNGNSLTSGAAQIRSRNIGFNFFARAISSGRGQIGTVSSTVVYSPSSYARYGSGNPHKEYIPYGINRFLTKPVIESAASFEELLENSIEVARSNKENALRHPFRG